MSIGTTWPTSDEWSSARCGLPLRQLAGLGCGLVVVTNQSGIARGLIRPNELLAVHARMQELLAAEGPGWTASTLARIAMKPLRLPQAADGACGACGARFGFDRARHFW